MIKTNDRISKFFEERLSKFVFVTYSEEFMSKLKIEDIMLGIPVPLSKEDLQVFAGGSGVSAVKIAENMTWILGCDPNFKYVESYKNYMTRFFDDKMIEDIVKVGVEAIGEGDLFKACIHFRAVLVFEPDMMEGMYNYARVCRQIYLDADDEEVIGFFKAEAIEYFERLTMEYPTFDKGFYFLGYMYLNLGLYTKAKLTFDEFVKISKDESEKAEIKKRMAELVDPQKIEAGCNLVISGKYEEGIAELEPFCQGTFEKWWPLHFYLGVAYEEVLELTKAIESYKKVIKLNASHIPSMEGLVRVYSILGDDDMTIKYLKKMEIIQQEV
ncbi:MAG: tetratricopeptide repeat protein [Anaerovoracaceae bacterium]